MAFEEEVFRVLFLGDSFTEGSGVDNEAIFAIQFGHLLTKMGVKNEVLNGGLIGYNMLDSYRYLIRYIDEIQPSLVILNVFVGNDLYGNFKSYYHPRLSAPYGIINSWYARDRLRFSTVHTGTRSVLFTDSYLGRLVKAIDEPASHYSFFYRMLSDKFFSSLLVGITDWLSITTESFPESVTIDAFDFPTDLAQLSGELQYKDPTTAVETAVRLAERTLLQFQRLCEKNGAELLVFIITGIVKPVGLDQGSDDQVDRLRPTKYLMDIMERHNIEHVDSVRFHDEQYFQGAYTFKHDAAAGHFGRKDHVLAAVMILEHVLKGGRADEVLRRTPAAVLRKSIREFAEGKDVTLALGGFSEKQVPVERRSEKVIIDYARGLVSGAQIQELLNGTPASEIANLMGEYLKVGLYEDVCSLYESRVKSLREDPVALFFYGAAYFQTKGVEKGVELMRVALALKDVRGRPDPKDRRMYLATQLHGVGRHAEASQILRNLLANGDNPYVVQNRKDIEGLLRESQKGLLRESQKGLE